MSIPNLWIQSLDFDPSFLQELLKNDFEIMKSFQIASLAINHGKYKNNKLKKRLKLSALKNQFIDIFLLKFLKRKNIIINIIVKSIKEYWLDDYDRVMEQLDKLLITPKCNCRNKGFGFCFHL
jgi:hypothetical protein